MLHWLRKSLSNKVNFFLRIFFIVLIFHLILIFIFSLFFKNISKFKFNLKNLNSKKIFFLYLKGTALKRSRFENYKNQSFSLKNNNFKNCKILKKNFKNLNRNENNLKKEEDLKITKISFPFLKIGANEKDLELVKDLIIKNWRAPILTNDCLVEIKINIGNNFKVEKYQIVKSSGIKIYDISALAALKEVIFPESLKNKNVTIILRN